MPLAATDRLRLPNQHNSYPHRYTDVAELYQLPTARCQVSLVGYEGEENACDVYRATSVILTRFHFEFDWLRIAARALRYRVHICIPEDVTGSGSLLV